MNVRIKESDWKAFKKIRPIALQRYCKRVMRDVEKTIHRDSADAHERYLEMYHIVQDSDKKLAQMFDRFSRSRALFQLMMYYDNNLLNEKELAQFSEGTRNRIIPS